MPVNDVPPFLDTLSRILLLHAPGVLTPVYVFRPSPANPVGTHPLDSFESWLMYEPKATVTWLGLFGSTPPDG